MSFLRNIFKGKKNDKPKSVPLEKREVAEEISTIEKPQKTYVSKRKKSGEVGIVKSKFTLPANPLIKLKPYFDLIKSDIYYLLTRKQLQIKPENIINIEDLYE